MRKIATLFKQVAPPTVRSDESAPDFPRLYKAESLDISLHLSSSSSETYLLIGILTCASESANAFEGMDADLYNAPGPYVRDGDEQEAVPFLRTQIDDFGHIVFRGVPEGEYILILHLHGLDVVIEELSIGHH